MMMRRLQARVTKEEEEKEFMRILSDVSLSHQMTLSQDGAPVLTFVKI